MDHSRHFANSVFPGRRFIVRGITRQWRQDGAVRLLLFPERKTKLVLRQESEMCPFQRARNRGSRDLLPIAAGLLSRIKKFWILMPAR